MTFTGGTGLSKFADQQRVVAQRATFVVIALAVVLAAIRSLAPVDPVVWLVLAGVSVFLPGVLSERYLERCWAVTSSTNARCRYRRKGFLTRCHRHRGTNTFDYLGALLALVTGLMVVWAAFTLPEFSV